MTTMWWRGMELDVDDLLVGVGWPSEREIMLALMDIRRFGGRGMSVWDHCQQVAHRCIFSAAQRPDEWCRADLDALRRAAIWHDAAEAITGDVIAPVRLSLDGAIDRALTEWQAAAMIALRLTDDPRIWDLVARVDRAAGQDELAQLRMGWSWRQ